MVNTRFERRHIIDYSYRNLKTNNFVNEKEQNYFSVTYWKKDDRLTIIRGLLGFVHLYKNVHVRKKVIKLRYNSTGNRPSLKSVKRFTSFLIPITDIGFFWFFLLSSVEIASGIIRYRNPGIYSFFMPLPLKAAIIRFSLRVHSPRLFESYGIPRGFLELIKPMGDKKGGYFTEDQYDEINKREEERIIKGNEIREKFVDELYQQNVNIIEAMKFKARRMFKSTSAFLNAYSKFEEEKKRYKKTKKKKLKKHDLLSKTSS